MQLLTPWNCDNMHDVLEFNVEQNLLHILCACSKQGKPYLSGSPCLLVLLFFVICLMTVKWGEFLRTGQLLYLLNSFTLIFETFYSSLNGMDIVYG